MLKLIELFGGIGACSAALTRCGIAYEIADYVEIDKYAVKSYNAIHGTNFEPQDITKWDKDIDVDLIMHGSPCQDFSVAGNGAGGDKGSGTRSSLMYETIRIVENLKPRVVVWENVKNLLSKKHRHNFEAYIETMSQLGYQSYYKVLNAKDYGIPQNRERIFTISIRGPHSPFVFPEKQPLELRLKDILEKCVDEKYYLSESTIKSFDAHKLRHAEKGNGFGWNPTDGEGTANTVATTPMKSNSNYIIQVGQLYGTDREPNPQAGRVYDSDGISPTMDTCSGGNRMPKVLIPEATKKGYAEASEGDSINLEQPNSKTRRGRVGKQVAQTLTTSPQQAVVEPFIAASRGRNPDNPSDRTAGAPTEQRLEPNKQGISNTISTVQKDNYVCEPVTTRGDDVASTIRASIHKQGARNLIENVKNGRGYEGVREGLRIRKLTPKECWRLMGFDDADFEKAEKVNSNTQLYKQAGNSIVVNVLCAIFDNLREVLEMEKIKEERIISYETDKMIDIAALAEKEPELFEELVTDYPVEANTTYQFRLIS